MIQGSRRPLMLLCLTVALVINVSGSTAQEEGRYLQNGVWNMTNMRLKVVPFYNKTLHVSSLMIKENMITLSEIDQKALASYPTLRQLHLEGNWVTDIPAHFFYVVPHLQILSLSENRIHSLDPQAFDGLSVLMELDLSHNNLTSLPSQLLRGIPNLKKLHLHENPWNCSCALLSIIREIKAANISIGSSGVTCDSPENQVRKNLSMALALCDQPSAVIVDPTKTTSVTTKQSMASSTILMKTQSSSLDPGISNDQTPGLGNTWKFTACIIALALTTSTLIVCSIKGPSWYKIFHNYRHRPLPAHYNDEDNVTSTDFTNIGRHHNSQTFSFISQNGQLEEEDEYYEDPYIKREG